MKTQLLEDIGESAALSPPTSKPAGNSNPAQGAAAVAPARKAPPARARAATGVWRQRLAGEPPAPTSPLPEEATPLELDKVFVEIAALEAQFVRPEQQEALVAPPSTVTRPQAPFFDFTPPAPAPQRADPSTPAPAGIAQSSKRPLVWAACALSAALLIWSGRSLVQEHNDAGSLALIASQVKGEARVEAVRHEPALAASAPLPAVPPLVMLEPDPPPVVKPEPAPRLAAARREPVPAPKPARAARQAAASPLPKPSIRKTRERSVAPAATAKERPQPDDTMAATLKACREHGYHASQCIKRQCSVGAYGFACRGR